MSPTSPSTTVSAILEAATGATDISAESANSIEGGIEAVVQTSATATLSAISTAATSAESADSINDGINAVVQSSASTQVVNTATSAANDALAAAVTATSDSAKNADSSTASVKDTGSSSTDVTSTTAKNSSSSSSSSASNSATTTSTSSTTSSSSQSTSTSTSATSTSNSTSTSSASTSATQSTTITAGPSSATSLQSLSAIQFTSTNSIGQPVTLTTYVAASSATAQNEDLSNTSTTEAFFQNKAAVGGVFGAVGLISLILLLAVVLKIVRYRANRKFERELNEQVDNEIRSGSPMFGFGKEDDGMSVRGMGMGMGAGMIDPEKSAYAGVGSYTSGNTAAYAAYGDRAPQAALQPAYYSPNASGGAPRRPSLGHSRAGSQGSNRSYGSLAGTPMNPFAPATFAAPPATFASPGYNYNNGPNYNYATASPAPPANYGEYRGPSPAPSTQSYQSFGARPGTPTALTPGGGRGSPAPGVAVPRGVYDPRTQSPGPGIIGSGIGVRPESPVVPLQYSRSSRGSREYVPSGLGRQPTQTLGVPAGNLSRGNSVNSIKAPLPNPFDERDS